MIHDCDDDDDDDEMFIVVTFPSLPPLLRTPSPFLMWIVGIAILLNTRDILVCTLCPYQRIQNPAVP